MSGTPERFLWAKFNKNLKVHHNLKSSIFLHIMNSKWDESSELKFTTDDHKPMDAEERRRIYETGGYVRYNRVNGNLALSRAFGDFGTFFKKCNIWCSECSFMSNPRQDLTLTLVFRI